MRIFKGRSSRRVSRPQFCSERRGIFVLGGFNDPKICEKSRECVLAAVAGRAKKKKRRRRRKSVWMNGRFRGRERYVVLICSSWGMYEGRWRVFARSDA